MRLLIKEHRADRRAIRGRRARPQRDRRARRSRTTGATSAWSSRTSSCCPNRTVYDNVAYALQVTGAPRKEIRAKVPDILRLTGLATKLHNYPDQLSGGEQQRVSVARAFVNHPPLLLADEPTGNLDPETSIGIMQLLYRINRTGTTVLVATHDAHDGRPHAPPRDRARAGPDRPRRGRRGCTADATEHGRVRRAAARAAAPPCPAAARRDEVDEAFPAMRPGFFLKEALRSMRATPIPSFAAMATRARHACWCSASSSRSCRRRPARPTRSAAACCSTSTCKTRRHAAATSPACARGCSNDTPHVKQGPVRLQGAGLQAGAAKRNPEAYKLLGLQPAARHLPRHARQARTTSARCATRSRPATPRAAAPLDRPVDRRGPEPQGRDRQDPHRHARGEARDGAAWRPARRSRSCC